MASSTLTSSLTRESVAALTVAYLRQELAKRSLPVSGLKSALVQRLEEALETEVHQAEAESDNPTPPSPTTSALVHGDDTSDISSSEDERGHHIHKRKRLHDTKMTDTSDSTTSEDPSSALVSLSQELKASHKERERLQFQLEEANDRVVAAKQEGRREAWQLHEKELADMRTMRDVALRKQEELLFKLSQRDDELQEYAANKQSEKQDLQHLKALKEEVKKRESLAFQCEQLKEQLDDYKQQVRTLQQKIEANQIHTEREKKETSRSLLEERGKAESLRVQLLAHRDHLAKEWRVEFDKQIEEEQEELKCQIRDTKKLQKELKEKTLLLEGQMADKLERELQKLADLQADLSDKENQLRENDKLQEELDLALEQRQRSIDEEAARLESDKQEFEEKQQALEKERQEFEERLWVVDRDVKRRRDKEKILDDQVMDLLAKNESLVAESALTKDTLLKQVKSLTIENERLQTSLALSQARVVSARGGVPSTVQSPRQEECTVEAPAADPVQDNAASGGSASGGSASGGSGGAASGRQTRSQSQLMRSQEQQTRELLLSKTRSRPSYIPKPSTRKIDITPLTNKPISTTNSNNSSNKENTHNNNSVVQGGGGEEISSGAEVQARRQRVSMIPIRKGSTLVTQQIKALRS